MSFRSCVLGARRGRSVVMIGTRSLHITVVLEPTSDVQANFAATIAVLNYRLVVTPPRLLILGRAQPA